MGPGTHPGVGSDLVDFLLSTIAVAMVPTSASLGTVNTLGSPVGSPMGASPLGGNPPTADAASGMASGRGSLSVAVDDGALASVDSLFWLTNVSVALLRRLLRSKLWTATTSFALQRAVTAMKVGFGNFIILAKFQVI